MALKKILFRGEETTFPDLSERFSIGLTTLRSRWKSGKRDDELVAPPDPTKCNKDDYRRYRAFAEKLERQRAIAARRAQLAAEHASVLSRPLIDGALLSEQERAQIRRNLGVARAEYLDGE